MERTYSRSNVRIATSMWDPVEGMHRELSFSLRLQRLIRAHLEHRLLSIFGNCGIWRRDTKAWSLWRLFILRRYNGQASYDMPIVAHTTNCTIHCNCIHRSIRGWRLITTDCLMLLIAWFITQLQVCQVCQRIIGTANCSRPTLFDSLISVVEHLLIVVHWPVSHLYFTCISPISHLYFFGVRAGPLLRLVTFIMFKMCKNNGNANSKKIHPSLPNNDFIGHPSMAFL